MRALLILALVAIAGCASPGGPHADPLFKAYLRYHEAVETGDIQTRRAEFFTPSVLKEIRKSSATQQTVLTMGGRITKVESHFARIGEARGCLTINGYSRNHEPASLFIEFRRYADTWRIRRLRLFFPESSASAESFQKAMCPDQAQDAIIRQFSSR